MTPMSEQGPLSPADEMLRRAACQGCAESKLLISRRGLLGGVTAGLFSWAFMPRYAEAASAGSDPRLLVVVLRGGLDGINTVVPVGDPHYVSMRGDIAIPASATIRLNSFFGLHPSLTNLGAMYRAGEAAFVHASCVPLRNRSHFDAQDNLESGLPGLASNPTGWLNRLLTALPAGARIVSRGAIQIGEAPLILRGPAPVLGWSPTWFSHVENPVLYMVRTLYRERDPALLETLEHGLAADRLAESVGGDDDEYSELRKGFRGAARLVGAPNGPRVAVLSVGGWDTHIYQGGEEGALAALLAELDRGIGDFKQLIGSAWRDTVMVFVTEFGRTVRVNGGDGTDHGVGTVAMLAGGAVNGGHILGDWPGLAPVNLHEASDLRPTTDLRSVFKGLLRDHLGVPANLISSTIFPQSSAAPMLRNLVRSGAAATDLAAGAFAPAPLASEPPIARYRRGQRVSMLRKVRQL
jgi:uncharacterized protein (DUF1501 family)